MISKIRLEYLLKSESKDPLKTQKNEMLWHPKPKVGAIEEQKKQFIGAPVDCVSVQPC